MDTHRVTQNIDPNNLPPGKHLQSGSILSERYLIQSTIGIGGMGAVYRARDLHFQNVSKYVAVKEMISQSRDALVRETIVQTFEREANLLATLNHPNIPKIYDFFNQNDRCYLVLEYINGKDMEALIEETKEFFTEEQVIRWAVEICDVLSFLHNHTPEPIIFRDMKPSNVMINQDNHVVLVDFGIAKALKIGQKGTMIGTEGYSPPEQYRGEATTSADIYALGATLHHLLTRLDPRLEAPFTFNDRPVRRFNPAISPELETVVSTALQYSAQDRFASAQAMKDALLGVARKTGLLSRISQPASTPVRSDSAIKPLWSFRCEDEIRSTGLVDSGMIYVGAYDNNIYALEVATGKFVWKFPANGGIVTRPSIIEGLLIFGSEDKQVYAITARSGKTIWSYTTQGAVRSSPAIAEGHIFFGSDDGYLHAINALNGRPVWRCDVGEAIRSSPAINNDLIYFGCESGELLSADYRGQIKWRFKAKRAITASPLVHQNMVFCPSLDGMMYALDSKTGWVIWRYRMNKGSVTSPCYNENYIYVGSADNNIYCLDANNAKEIWRFTTGHQVSGSPLAHKDAIYCGSADGNLYCLEARTGRLRWQFTTGGPITSCPLIVNNVLYIGSSDHTLYALPV